MEPQEARFAATHSFRRLGDLGDTWYDGVVKRRSILISGSCLLLLPMSLRADYRDDISFTFLTNRLGGTQVTGAGISVSQIESPENGSNYVADAANPEFIGKQITAKSGGSTNSSSHATEVGTYFYGLSNSICPGISTISAYHVGNWVEDDMLKTSSVLAPGVESNRVENHSWVGTYSAATNLMLRLDYAIVRDGFTCVVATDNSGGTNLPEIPSQGYNTITVGRSDGGHSAGFTTFDAPDRVKPDLVAPLPQCSIAAPVVAAAAAHLLNLTTNPALTAAAVPEAIKAILMAGATKDEFPSWDRTTTRPLDEQFGAGELNVFNSHRILTAGSQTPGTTNLVSISGWSVHTPPSPTNMWYIFNVPTNTSMTRLSAVLTWNRVVTDGPVPVVFDPTGTVANLTLTLHAMSNFVAGAVVDQSSSAVDNVEHVYERGLPAGQYGLEVTTDSAIRYCLAWEGRISVTPDIASVSLTNADISVSSTASQGNFYSLDVSTNLSDAGGGWSQLQTGFATTNSVLFVDTTISNHIRRFYRVTADP